MKHLQYSQGTQEWIRQSPCPDRTHIFMEVEKHAIKLYKYSVNNKCYEEK